MIFNKLKALIAEQLGVDADTITLEAAFVEDLLNAFDEDVVAAKAGVTLDPDRDPTPEEQAKLDVAQEELIKEVEECERLLQEEMKFYCE